ncbi:MAG TPA: exodeoxyribonuclease VII large subunit [Acidimicrobiales bacterium]|nr:exodeoxyribonuclease VII large subunit [Acidimicrobiales bacterium]
MERALPAEALPAAAQFAGMEQAEPQSVSSLLAGVRAALALAFPRQLPLWVRGEIQSISDHRSGHCYIDLVDPDTARDAETPVLKVNCWRSTWGPMRADLARQGINLEVGMVVTLRGRVEFYAPRGQVNFIATELDVHALLGRLAQQRAALLTALGSEGLLERNKALPVPVVPLRIGLVASSGTEGYRDFLGQLLGSGAAFEILHVVSRVQGISAAASVAAGLRTLSDARCDLVVLVRGGGSKADLAVFDTEPVARAVATCACPVWTGIGHTGDQSVADIVANRAFITPTEAGAQIAALVEEWWDSFSRRATRVAERAQLVLASAERRDDAARSRLTAGVHRQLTRHAERLGERGTRIRTLAPRALEAASVSLAQRSARLGPRALAVLERGADRVGSWRRLLAAYDVERQLERGYSLTYDDRGSLVRGVGQLERGAALVTRVADGTARSTVDEVHPAPPPVAGPTGAGEERA